MKRPPPIALKLAIKRSLYQRACSTERKKQIEQEAKRLKREEKTQAMMQSLTAKAER